MEKNPQDKLGNKNETELTQFQKNKQKFRETNKLYSVIKKLPNYIF
jgi:hypothetical protein